MCMLKGWSALKVPRDRLYALFMPERQTRIACLRGVRLMSPGSTTWGFFVMFDVFIMVMGVGGLLLMALYASLCERI
jgi:hypothetical protein